MVHKWQNPCEVLPWITHEAGLDLQLLSNAKGVALCPKTYQVWLLEIYLLNFSFETNELKQFFPDGHGI